MVPVRLRIAVVAALFVACGGPEYDALVREMTNDAFTYTCPSGEVIGFPIDDTTSVATNLSESEGCVGLSEMCPMDGARPQDAACADANVNRFIGTCVERFLACYRPSGTCNDTGSGGQLWSSGEARYGDFNVRFVPAGESEPCIIGDVSYGDQFQVYLIER